MWRRLTKEEELLKASTRGDREEVARLVDKERVDVDSMNRVSVCVLCLLILVLFGIGWRNCSDVFLSIWSLERGTSTIGSRSEPDAQGKGK